MTRQTSTEAMNALDDAALWAASLDRSMLGAFAHSDEVFVAYAARLTPGLSSAVQAELTAHAADIWYRDNPNGIHSGHQPVLLIFAEVFFWRSLSAHNDAWAALTTENVEGLVLIEFNRLKQVYSHPSFHTFYQAGIWDDAFIAKCIANDIDASMAVGIDAQSN